MSANPESSGFLSELGKLLSAPWRTLRRFVRDLVEADERLRDTESWSSRLLAVITLPARLLWGFILFMVHAWASSREGFAFLRGLPALAVAGGFFVALVLADFVYNEARMVAANTGYYQYHAQKSPQHPEWSEMFARKLTEIKPDDPLQKFRLGVALDRGGQSFEALDIMSSLAKLDDDEPGFGQPHLWLANRMLKQEAEGQQQAEQEQQAIAHLEAALDSEADSLEARVELAKLYQRQADRLPEGDEKILPLLELVDQSLQAVMQDEEAIYYRVVSMVPSVKVRLQLAELDPENYKLNAEKRRVADMIDGWMPLAKRRFPDEIFLWQSLVASAVEIKDNKKALDIIRAGMELDTETQTKKQLEQLAARAFLVFARDVDDVSQRESYRRRLGAICRAIRFNPGEKAAYAMLLDYISTPNKATPNEELGDRVGQRVEVPQEIRWLQEEALNPDLSGVLYALIGMQKISVGDISGGRKSWSIGQQRESQTQTYIFQLLDVAAGLDDGRFDNMHDMITLAIELFPEQPAFYVTRGIFLKNQKRYEEAIVDLKYVAQRSPEDVVINQQLKFCYEKIGDEEGAAEQARLIEERLAEQDLQQRQQSEQLLQRLEARERQRL